MNGFDLSTASNICIGGAEVSAVYLGSTKIWPSVSYYTNRYLTIIPRSTAYVCYNNRKGHSQGYYSLDGGTTWTAFSAYDTEHVNAWKEDTTVEVQAGEKIMLKDTHASSAIYKPQIHVTANYDIEGNIMSMQDGDNFRSSTSLAHDNTFQYMFQNETGLKKAQYLIMPIMTMRPYCYSEMFKGCTGMTSTPYLPATTLDEYCYYHMFDGCTSLQYACNHYDEYIWFGGYRDKYGLPATSMPYAYSCYEGMFYGCTNLIGGPVLPAQTLNNRVYKEMFYGCSNLIRIYCFATDISASNCTLDWVNGVNNEYPGRFVKAASMSNWTRGNDGIPTRWTIDDNSLV